MDHYGLGMMLLPDRQFILQGVMPLPDRQFILQIDVGVSLSDKQLQTQLLVGCPCPYQLDNSHYSLLVWFPCQTIHITDRWWDAFVRQFTCHIVDGVPLSDRQFT